MIQEDKVVHAQDTVEQDVVGQEQPTVQAQKESQQEMNFRNLRQKTEQLQRERDEYYRALQEIESRKSQQVQAEETQLNPDDLVEWKHVQRELKKVKEELNSYKQQSQQQTSEARIKAQYPDFDKVVNESTIALLREQYPELAQSINAHQDVYTKASAVYTLIKKFDLAPSDATLLERARIQENIQKPRPLSSVAQQGDSPLAKANAFAQGLTDELRNQLLKEMQEAKKRL